MTFLINDFKKCFDIENQYEKLADFVKNMIEVAKRDLDEKPHVRLESTARQRIKYDSEQDFWSAPCIKTKVLINRTSLSGHYPWR
ncbi:hypothetical protein AAU57_14760 [Nonlabens sp. YIK11]|uniref:hypothetical protein n=1 Tax=Nonlabens sp. YIK11 TaxID=1453349 RepID=UPI0006DC9848|nr:hypothetical protein AAU57_14640 [Nonlabens sp. YIK11]KQC31870.1 hypothetical protein AAU57_14760 [Nonlabens sp. YIK11]